MASFFLDPLLPLCFWLLNTNTSIYYCLYLHTPKICFLLVDFLSNSAQRQTSTYPTTTRLCWWRSTVCVWSRRPEYVNSVRTLCQLISAEHIEKIVLHTHTMHYEPSTFHLQCHMCQLHGEQPSVWISRLIAAIQYSWRLASTWLSSMHTCSSQLLGPFCWNFAV